MSKNIADFCSGVNHIGVPTLDYNKSVAFYEGLGFKKAHTKVNPNGQQVAFMQCGNLIVETYDKEGAAMKIGAINHIAVDVHNIDDLYQIIKQKDILLFKIKLFLFLIGKKVLNISLLKDLIKKLLNSVKD